MLVRGENTAQEIVLTGRAYCPEFDAARALASFISNSHRIAIFMELQATLLSNYIVSRSFWTQDFGRRRGCASVLKTQSSKLMTSLGSENIK